MLRYKSAHLRANGVKQEIIVCFVALTTVIITDSCD